MSHGDVVDLIIRNVDSLVSLAGAKGGALASPGWDDLGLIEGGSLAARDGVIVEVGLAADVESAVEPDQSCRIIDGSGKMLLPGFVDPHTHFLFAGSREEEYGMRAEGIDYMEIRRRGGGILSSVRAFREASDEDLFEIGRRRLDRFLENGTTTVEGKSGYGLTLSDEVRALRIMAELDASHTVDVVRTFLGAHEIPEEYRSRREDYIRLVIDEMIPAVEGLAEFCDVFCEKGVFSVEESRSILESAKGRGMLPKLHAEEFAPMGGGKLAAEVGAVSADHLLVAPEDDVRALASSGTIAVFLPGTAIGLAQPHFADPKHFRTHGVPIALATDCNPGSSYTQSMPAIISLATSLCGLTVPESIVGATRNGAAAVGRLDSIGTLEKGKRADCLLFDSTNPADIPYQFAARLLCHVIKGGRSVWDSGMGGEGWRAS